MSRSRNEGEMKRHMVKYMLGGPLCRKKQKEKKSSTFYITATLNNMINRVHLSCVEGHPTQAVISDQA